MTASIHPHSAIAIGIPQSQSTIRNRSNQQSALAIQQYRDRP